MVGKSGEEDEPQNGRTRSIDAEGERVFRQTESAQTDGSDLKHAADLSDGPELLHHRRKFGAVLSISSGGGHPFQKNSEFIQGLFSVRVLRRVS